MCDICCTIFSNAKQHDVAQCPLRESMYCNVCQVYGHATNVCPDKSAWRTRVPEFVEQLIPIACREHYGIETLTPLSSKCDSPRISDYTATFEIVDRSAKSIRAALTSLGVQSTTEAENKRVLERLCLAQGKKLVYLQDEIANLPKQTNTKRKKITLKKSSEPEESSDIPQEQSQEQSQGQSA